MTQSDGDVLLAGLGERGTDVLGELLVAAFGRVWLYDPDPELGRRRVANAMAATMPENRARLRPAVCRRGLAAAVAGVCAAIASRDSLPTSSAAEGRRDSLDFAQRDGVLESATELAGRGDLHVRVADVRCGSIVRVRGVVGGGP